MIWIILHGQSHDSPLSFLSIFPSFSQSCAIFFSLLPFFLSSALYFYLWTPDSPPSLMSAGAKSAPTVLLAAMVLSWNGGQSVLGVAGGLIFSAVGDCCLVWPELFLHGKSFKHCKSFKQRLAHFPGQINLLQRQFCPLPNSTVKSIL